MSRLPPKRGRGRPSLSGETGERFQVTIPPTVAAKLRAYGGGSHGGWGNAEGGSRWTYQQAEDIVRRAYRSTLGRDPDSAARSWVNEVMKNNWSQRQLEAELRKSDEYRNKQGQ